MNGAADSTIRTAARVRRALADFRKVVILLWNIQRGPVLFQFALEALGAAETVAQLYVAKRIIDSIVDAARLPGHPLGAVVFWVTAELALVLFRYAVRLTTTVPESRFSYRYDMKLREMVMTKCSRIDYAHFEDPAFVAQLAIVRRTNPMMVYQQALAIFRATAVLAGSFTLLAPLGGWVILVIVAAILPSLAAGLRTATEGFDHEKETNVIARKAHYLETLVTSEASLREVKALNIGEWVINRYQDVATGLGERRLAVTLSGLRRSTAVQFLADLSYYGTFVFIALRAATGAITIGAMTIYLTIFKSCQSTIQSIVSSVSGMFKHTLDLRAYFDFLDLPEELAGPQGEVIAVKRPPEIRFENVSFRYPGTAHDALTDVSFTIRAGETVALVGRNGSGKSTLVKLLIGLFAPSGGRILLDGIDIASIPAVDLRRRISVVFQDYLRFQLTVAENVGVGWLPKRDDRDALVAALGEGGAQQFVEELPHGIDTQLGRTFGGSELSMGQWQRLALARAALRGSRVLVLDEPTASMDSEAEQALFERVNSFKEQRTTLLVTHRFSTIRIADRVVVLDRGTVAEEGTHDELMSRGGHYARFFELQTAGWRPRQESNLRPTA